MGLDWDAPACPPGGAEAQVPIQVEVDQGMLTPSLGGSLRAIFGALHP
jgi:hypothetical protein